MFVPNTACFITKFSDTYDAYGARLAGERVETKCGIVKLYASSHKTTVRADSGASRGNAQEYRADAVILFDADEKVSVDDIVELYDMVLKVEKVFPRVDVYGRLDHWQVDLIRSSGNG